MVDQPDPVQQRASREATEWLILLADDPTNVHLRQKFEAWLRHSAANGAAWQAMQQASKAMDKARPVHAERWGPMLADLRGAPGGGRSPVASAHRGTSRRKPPAAAGFGRRRALGLIGAVAVPCLVAAAVGPDILLNLRSDYATGTAETKSIRLADGSTVTLAPESAIAVALSPRQRAVQLLAGEAYFEVSPKPDSPFRVVAKDVRVTVLGTAFGVRHDDEATEVAVEHGIVQVSRTTADPPMAETLTAGQSVRVSSQGDTARSETPADRIAAWRRSLLIARDEPLSAVVDRLRRHYAGTIFVTDDALAARPVTGVYNLADPVDALRGIARAQNAVVRRMTPWVVVISPS